MLTIECPAELDIAAASALHQQLLSAIQGKEALVINGQAIRRIHAAGLQLLLSLVRHSKETALPISWSNPSPALLESAQLLGLSDDLGLGAPTNQP